MKFAAAALIALVALFGLMTFFQDQLLFPTGAVPRAGALPAGAEKLQFETADGETIHGVYLKPAPGGAEPKTLLVGFGGNAWNAQHVAEYLHDVFPGAHVAAFHYRGYRPSTGKPSAAALLEDAPAAYRLAVEKVGPERTIAVGFSIGSGIAASLSGEAGLDGLILVTPFDSLKAVAAEIYPFLPVGALFQHEIDTAALLGDSDVPVAIIAAERDEIIPPARTDALRPRVKALKFDRTIAGAGHNDIYGNTAFEEGLRRALQAVTGS